MGPSDGQEWNQGAHSLYTERIRGDDFHDIDIAIHLCKEQSPYQRFKLAQKVARSLEQGIHPRIDFDVRILDYAPAYFQYEVISKGIVVVERDRKRSVDYEADLISEYLDLKYMYDLFDQAFLARAWNESVIKSQRAGNIT